MFQNVSVRPSGIAIPGASNPPPGYAEMNGWMGGGGSFLQQIIGNVGVLDDGIPQWSYWPNFRDNYLRMFWKTEPILGGAVYTLTARIATLGFRFDGRKKNTKRYYQLLAGHCDNEQGLSNVFAKTVLSLLTQDNGAFWYLHGGGRPDKKLRGRVQDIRFLDSAQCWRSLDPEFPVYYNDPLTGKYYRLHKTRVVSMSSLTQTDELGRNVGFCAVSRIMSAARIIRDIRRYKSEKVSGMPSRGLLTIMGLTIKQLRAAMVGNEKDAEQLGYMRFKGIDTLASTNRELKAELTDLASVPDGWVEKDDVELYVNIVALILGVDPREIWPATTTGATKADAELSHLKAKGKGIGDLIRICERAMNWHVIGEDAGVEFGFNFKDIEEERATAEINQIKTNTYSTSVASGSMTPEEMRAMQLSDGTLNPSVLANLAATQQYDDESPVTDENESENALVPMDISDQVEQDDENGDENTDDQSSDNANEDDESEDKPNNKFKRKQKAKTPEFEPITVDDINTAIAALGKLI